METINGKKYLTIDEKAAQEGVTRTVITQRLHLGRYKDTIPPRPRLVAADEHYTPGPSGPKPKYVRVPVEEYEQKNESPQPKEEPKEEPQEEPKPTFEPGSIARQLDEIRRRHSEH